MVLGAPALAHAQLLARRPAPAAVEPVVVRRCRVRLDLDGVVRDEQGAPVAGAVVSALGAHDGVRGHRRATAGSSSRRCRPARTSSARTAAASSRRGRRSFEVRAERARRVVDRARGEADGRAGDPGRRARRRVGQPVAPSRADSPTAADRRPTPTHRPRRPQRNGVAPAACAPRRPEGCRRCRAICSPTTPERHRRPWPCCSAERSSSPARVATSFFADTPFSGQVNLLTTARSTRPSSCSGADSLARGIAYVQRRRAGRRSSGLDRARRADPGRHLVVDRRRRVRDARRRRGTATTSACRTARSATTAATRWRCARSPTAAATPARSTAFDTFTVTPAVTRHLRRALRTLRLPRAARTCSARASSSRVDAGRVARGSRVVALAPRRRAGRRGIPAAERRRASGCRRSAPSRRSSRDGRFDAERTTHVSARGRARLRPRSTVTLRAFRQQVDDQLVTLFGVDVPGLAGRASSATTSSATPATSRPPAVRSRVRTAIARPRPRLGRVLAAPARS